MAYNLDFSGWKDARKAQSDSIMNQATIAANLIAQKQENINKMISTLGGAALHKYSDIEKQKEAEDMFNAAASTGLLPETSGDIMQDLSSRNAITGNEELDERNALLFKKWLMKKYGFGGF